MSNFGIGWLAEGVGEGFWVNLHKKGFRDIL